MQPNNRLKRERECPYCHKKFVGNNMYCCQRHSYLAKRKKVEPKYCETCGELLDPSLFCTKLEYEKARFCGKKCGKGRLRKEEKELVLIKTGLNSWSTDNGVTVKVFREIGGWIWKAYKDDKMLIKSVGFFPERRNVIIDMEEVFS